LSELQYRCPTCGAIFHDVDALGSHFKGHEAEASPAKPDARTLQAQLQHDDDYLGRVRVPMFATAFAFFLMFGYAVASRAPLFVPVFLGATFAMIVVSLYLMKAFL
jgi:hypothetical protein